MKHENLVLSSELSKAELPSHVKDLESLIFRAIALRQSELTKG